MGQWLVRKCACHLFLPMDSLLSQKQVGTPLPQRYQCLFLRHQFQKLYFHKVTALEQLHSIFLNKVCIRNVQHFAWIQERVSGEGAGALICHFSPFPSSNFHGGVNTCILATDHDVAVMEFGRDRKYCKMIQYFHNAEEIHITSETQSQ